MEQPPTLKSSIGSNTIYNDPTNYVDSVRFRLKGLHSFKMRLLG